MLAVLVATVLLATYISHVGTLEVSVEDLASPWLQQTDFQAVGGGGTAPPHSDDAPLFCFVVRTYWGHGDKHGGGLRHLLRSLQRQQHQRWEAVLILADNRPFPDLHHILQDMNDTRAWVFAEWIGAAFKPKDKGEWQPGYHGRLFNLTDDAIQVCPPETQWLVVTNGDNEYGAGFMERVLEEAAAPPPAPDLPPPDIVAFDFYSRFLRPTAPACDRFAAAPGAPPCKRNRLRWCHSDLGAAALRWQRFQAEGRLFAAGDGSKYGLDEEHFDGIMMEALAQGGWRAAHVTDACLFVHAPSAQSCGWGGGAWDDRDIVGSGGGRCVTQAEADAIMRRDADAEEVRVAVANDGNAAAFEGADQGALAAVRCLRRRDHLSEGAWGLAMVWYSEWCADDAAEYGRQLKAFYATPAALDEAGSRAVAHAAAARGAIPAARSAPA